MGFYQLCFLKMHGNMLYLSDHLDMAKREVLVQILSDTLSAANEAMPGRNFTHSPYREGISVLAAGAAAALVCLERDEREEMHKEILSALHFAEQSLL